MSDEFGAGVIKLLIGLVALAFVSGSIVRWDAFKRAMLRMLENSGRARAGWWHPTDESAWWGSVLVLLTMAIQGVVLVGIGLTTVLHGL